MLLNVDELLAETQGSGSRVMRGPTAVKPTVLIATANAVCRSLGRTALQSFGYQVFVAVTADEAVRIFHGRSDPGLVFVDESFDGRASVFLRQIRQAGFLSPFILLSDRRSWWRRYQARRAGFAATIRRQPTPEEFLAIVNEFLPVTPKTNGK